MISKSEIKLITALRQKKYRDQHQLFVAETPKVVNELLNCGLIPSSIFTTVKEAILSSEVQEVSENELKKISSLKNPNICLAIFKIAPEIAIKTKGLIVALDAIRDPGNLGTIIRLCDWFGVTQLVCSIDTVDCYNSKVVQATMGSLGRVSIKYVELSYYLNETQLPIYGGVLEGENIHKMELPKNAVVLLGNEGNGISSAIVAQLTTKVTIPQFGTSKETESLNVATATAILLNEFRRTTEK